ncbi:hypothetical protein [Streptomyces sp. ISL-100]|uniref:hypothetical protein n=1 Tax=Streptomyces sp. ISL-100 TaxID=2819173 RepID=UPI001BE84A83|nr:hypothetical protein [Streptomyces sp. ISL-100]MBT2397012.1 hypothetical protein [Streptomyces sp. ISL-100]
MSGVSANGGAGRVQQAGQTAKEEASVTAGQAKQAAGEVAGSVAQQAKAVTGEARQQAGTAARDLRGRVSDEVQGQAERAVGTLRKWADDLDGMAQNAPGDSPVRSLVAQAADGGHRAADYLDKNGLGSVVEDVRGFARRRPGAFLGGAALAGLAVGRMAKAGKAQAGAGGDGGRRAGSAAQFPQDPPVQVPPPETDSSVAQAPGWAGLPGAPEV